MCRSSAARPRSPPTPRVKIDTPRLSGSISLKGARIDDLSLVQFRETVDPDSPAIVSVLALEHREPYYAEFGWVPAAGSTVNPSRETATGGINKMSTFTKLVYHFEAEHYG